MPIYGLEDDIREIAAQAVAAASRSLLADLVEEAPVDTGELRESAYGPVVTGQLSRRIGFRAPQAEWTDQGTRPHRISARRGSRLTFFWPNGPEGPKVYSFASVNHPGNEGTGWFTKMIDKWNDYVQDALRGT